jgi:hypothetical protein
MQAASSRVVVWDLSVLDDKPLPGESEEWDLEIPVYMERDAVGFAYHPTRDAITFYSAASPTDDESPPSTSLQVYDLAAGGRRPVSLANVPGTVCSLAFNSRVLAFTDDESHLHLYRVVNENHQEEDHADLLSVHRRRPQCSLERVREPLGCVCPELAQASVAVDERRLYFYAICSWAKDDALLVFDINRLLSATSRPEPLDLTAVGLVARVHLCQPVKGKGLVDENKREVPNEAGSVMLHVGHSSIVVWSHHGLSPYALDFAPPPRASTSTCILS